MSTKVCCPCPVCQGKQVSNYIRHQHMKKFVVNVSSSINQEHQKEVTDHEELPVTLQDHDQESRPTDVSTSAPPTVELNSDRNLESDHSMCDDDSPKNLPDQLALERYDLSIYDDDQLAAPLYDGSNVSVLDSVVKYLHWFSNHPGISKEALSDILRLEHSEILPSGNKLPSSYNDIMKLAEPFLIQPILFHACPNDCVVFRGEYTGLSTCPICDAPRYTSGGVPAKRFTYLPVGPRLVRLFGTSSLSQIVQAHQLNCDKNTTLVYDIHSAPTWKQAYSYDGQFVSDSRGISFALNTDGVNPYSQNRVSYSMWPIILTVLNLPRDIRYSFGNFWLVGTVPGNGTKEPNSLDSYLNILVDELLSLSNKTVYDAYQGAPFQLKVDVLMYVLDYPGISKVFNVLGANAYQACAWCQIEGTYFTELHKMVYLDNRRYLPMSSELRQDKNSFPSKSVEDREPPSCKTYSLMKDVHAAYDVAKTKQMAAAVAKSTGCKGSYCLMKLPNHNRVLQTFPDAMHTVKDSIERVFFLLIGKSKLEKIALLESKLKRFGFGEHARKRKRGAQGPVSTVKHPYVLSSDELKLADTRSKSIVMTNTDFNPGEIFFRTTGLKSHDWKELASRNILKFCLRGMLQPRQRKTLFLFLDAIRKILGEGIDLSKLDELENEVNLALAMMERDFPADIQVVTIHLLRHIVDGMKQFGPVYASWMFAYERFNSWLHRRVMNRRYPEATLMETYRIFEWCHYMIMSGRCTSPHTEDSSNKNAMQELDNDVYALLVQHYKNVLPTIRDHESLELTKQVCVCSRITVKCKCTGRLIGFTAHKDGQRYSCSYVQVCGLRTCVGRIRMCFTHEFSGKTSEFVLVDIFPDPNQDSESSLWWVSLDEAVYQDVFEISCLSAPLVTAKEDQKLWFLTLDLFV